MYIRGDTYRAQPGCHPSFEALKDNPAGHSGHDRDLGTTAARGGSQNTKLGKWISFIAVLMEKLFF